jgi:hypothetical protein
MLYHLPAVACLLMQVLVHATHVWTLLLLVAPT